MTLIPRIAGVSLASLVLLSGCVLERTPEPTQSNTPSFSATPSPSATAPTGATPVTIACSDLVTDQVIYDWGSGNWATDDEFSPEPNSAAAAAVSELGVACGWLHLSSGATLVVSVANLSSSDLASLKASIAAESEAVTTFDAEGYFASDGVVGIAHVFSGSYWISAESEDFFEAGDAAMIVAAALSAVE